MVSFSQYSYTAFTDRLVLNGFVPLRKNAKFKIQINRIKNVYENMVCARAFLTLSRPVLTLIPLLIYLLLRP